MILIAPGRHRHRNEVIFHFARFGARIVHTDIPAWLVCAWIRSVVLVPRLQDDNHGCEDAHPVNEKMAYGVWRQLLLPADTASEGGLEDTLGIYIRHIDQIGIIQSSPVNGAGSFLDGCPGFKTDRSSRAVSICIRDIYTVSPCSPETQRNAEPSRSSSHPADPHQPPITAVRAGLTGSPSNVRVRIALRSTVCPHWYSITPSHPMLGSVSV